MEHDNGATLGNIMSPSTTILSMIPFPFGLLIHLYIQLAGNNTTIGSAVQIEGGYRTK